jgi:hypothetical protein
MKREDRKNEEKTDGNGSYWHDDGFPAGRMRRLRQRSKTGDKGRD